MFLAAVCLYAVRLGYEQEPLLILQYYYCSFANWPHNNLFEFPYRLLKNYVFTKHIYKTILQYRIYYSIAYPIGLPLYHYLIQKVDQETSNYNVISCSENIALAFLLPAIYNLQQNFSFLDSPNQKFGYATGYYITTCVILQQA